MIRILHQSDVTPFELPTTACSIGLLDFLRRSLKKQWRDYRKDFARCRRKFSEKSVHQFRIESRRLLSTLSVLRAIISRRHLNAGHHALKKRLRVFPRLRDTHVQLLAIEDLEREFPQLAPFADTLPNESGASPGASQRN